MLVKSVLCIDFPPLVRLELNDCYKSWHENCLFATVDSIAGVYADLIILPVEKLLISKITSKPRIAFGPEEMLETSFLCGAVDYLKDPWNCSELIIRSQPYLEGLTLQKENISLLYRNGCLIINDKYIDLSPCQSKLMKILMKHANSFVGYSLLKEILGIKSVDAAKSIHVHMHKLRSTLRQELPCIYGKSLYIKNCSTMGYALIFTCG